MTTLFSRRARRIFLFGFALTTAIGLLLASYRYLDQVVHGHRISPLAPLLDEITAAWAAALLFLLIIRLARRFPLDRPGWLRRLPVHLAGAAVFAAAHTTLMWGTRVALYPLAGLGSYDYGRMPLRYLMELPQQLILYCIVVALVHLYDRHRAAQQRELKISQLETELVRARLEALRMQLNPHFLFNALNTISSVMYEDVPAADTMLTRLAELLRRTMSDAEAQEVPLSRELEILDLYLVIMRARFGESLEVQISVDPEAAEARVPSLLLQPLVENAIAHGGAAAGAEPLRIEVGVRRQGERLQLQVRDWGRGADGAENTLLGHGIGLTNTAERLRKLYGDEHRLETRNASQGGFLVSIELPYRSASPAAEPEPAVPVAGLA